MEGNLIDLYILYETPTEETVQERRPLIFTDTVQERAVVNVAFLPEEPEANRKAKRTAKQTKSA